MACFGRDASRRDPRGRVLVATQVIEQSLDLDFDVMVSDVAPVDLLVQRAGRLWRHATRTKTGRPAGASETLVVLAPVPSDDPSSEWLDGIFAGTAAVYENPGVLWRTVKALHDRGCIEAPGGLRGLIGSVYDSDEVPDALSEKTQRAEGEQGAHKAAATYGVLRPREGYHATAKSWLHDLRVPTRLGDARTTVRLARVGAGGALEPWVLAEGPPWKAWALSEVSVSAKRVPPTCTVDPRFAEAVVRVRAGWGAFDQEILILPLEATTPGEWTGRLVAPGRKGQRGFRYSIELGLAFHEPDP